MTDIFGAGVATTADPASGEEWRKHGQETK
jgi:hypothetical protein